MTSFLHAIKNAKTVNGSNGIIFRFLPIFAVAFLALSSEYALARTYYVAPNGNDRNSGTINQPWRTIGEANKSLRPGDTVLIRAATYHEQIRPIRSGSSDSQRITYKAYGDGDVNLTYFPYDGAEEVAEGAIALGQRDFITVSGRADGDPETKQRIRLLPKKNALSLGNVCGSKGVIVENIYAACQDDSHSCSRGFAFCINYWIGDYETKYNVLRNSHFIGNSNLSENPLKFTEDLITIAKAAHHNLIANNTFEIAKHVVVTADSPVSHSNVIRNNIIKNPQHTALSIWSAGVKLKAGARFLIENNHLEATGQTKNPHGGPGNSLQWGSAELIIRYNIITQGGSRNNQNRSVGGLSGATSTSYNKPYFACDGRVYNNTIVNNSGVAIGMFNFNSDPVDLGRHKFVNNFIYGSKSPGTGHRLIEYWDSDFDTSDPYINNVFGNPGGTSRQKIIFTKRGEKSLSTAIANLRNPKDPEFTAWNGFNNLYDPNPGFNNYHDNDYSLPRGNKYIDAGTYLTTVQSGCGTRRLKVGDSRFFFAEAAEFPAWMDVEMDWVAIGSRLSDAVKQQISSVDDTKNRLTFTTNINCKNGDKVWLWKDSSGGRVVYGAAPDIGANESLPHDEKITLPVPENLKILVK